MTFESLPQQLSDDFCEGIPSHTRFIEVKRGRRSNSPFSDEPTWEKAIKFSAWIYARRTSVAAADVMERFGCSRASAYRWLRFFADVHGLEIKGRLIGWTPGSIDVRDIRCPQRPGAFPAYAGAAH
jgi:hypothetical protein